MQITMKAARINVNLSQEEAATRLGVSKATIINWENGRSFPDVMQLKRIEEVYGVSYNNLLFLPQVHA